MFMRSLMTAGFTAACLVALIATPSALADGSLSDGTRATLRADFMRQQAVIRAQSQLGYQRLYTDDDDVTYSSPAASRYATIDDQIARLAAMIAANKAKTNSAFIQP